MWMAEYEIDDAAHRFSEHPVLGPATRTLANLRDVVNDNSDGWPYWRKPANAARGLMELIDRGFRWDREAYQLPRTAEPTEAELKAAYRSMKAFRTRSGLDFGIEMPREGPR